MTKINQDSSLTDAQAFVKETYNYSNDRYFEMAEMLNNIQRFSMRGLKGIRKGDIERTKQNLIVSFTWFLSTLNRLMISLETEVWKRFPYLCSYCGSCPCICKKEKIDSRIEVPIDYSKKPGTLKGLQKMFKEIYPPSQRTLDNAGVHLAEEIGEFSEKLISYRIEKKNEDFEKVKIEAADYISCLLGIFNSLNLDFAQEISEMFGDSCHECHNAPCTCSYEKIKDYKF